MHPSFPAPDELKVKWALEAKKEILKASREADCVVISHYHWDHFLPGELEVYRGKTLFAKNPNEYINESQRERALEFFSRLWRELGGVRLNLEKRVKTCFPDPAQSLRSVKLDMGEYNERRKELLEKGRKWFKRRVEAWKKWGVIPEVNLPEVKVVYPEGKAFRYGETTLRFTQPLFHGIEYSRLGWVFSTIIEHDGEKLIYTSDLNGPIIEDYADLIIAENPDYIILDGPMTYMLGYTLNLINLKRVIENVKRIVEEADFN